MKIVFMGTPFFAVAPLQALAKTEREIALVVTMPDRPRGRSGTPLPSPVKELALALGCEIYQPSKITTSEAIERIKSLTPDVIVVAAYGGILPKTLLDQPKYGALNIHGSLLPKYRGAAPIERALLEGEKRTGITIIQMEPTVDTGDILLQEAIDVSEADDRGSLTMKLSQLGAEMIVETLKLIEKNEIRPISQREEFATYTKKLEKEEFVIRWDSDSGKISNLVRALSPKPGAQTFFKGKLLKILRAKPVDAKPSQKPGRVESASPEAFAVSTGNGILKIEELQLEGKKRMAYDEFIKGNPIKPGESLG